VAWRQPSILPAISLLGCCTARKRSDGIDNFLDLGNLQAHIFEDENRDDIQVVHFGRDHGTESYTLNVMTTLDTWPGNIVYFKLTKQELSMKSFQDHRMEKYSWIFGLSFLIISCPEIL